MVRDSGTTKNRKEIDQGAVVAEENLVIDAQYLIQGILNERELTRSDLAKLTGISKARLTQLMRPDANPTLRTFARLMSALGEEVVLSRKSQANVSEGKPRAADSDACIISEWVSEERAAVSFARLRGHSRRSQALYEITRRSQYIEMIHSTRKPKPRIRGDLESAVV
jgi:transcriptional regulator with XRE-family HTH domain